MTPERLLSAWEQGVQRHPIDRALLMFSLSRPDLSAERLADQPLGMRNAALMRLHRNCFGKRLLAWLDCPGCGERMEFELDDEQLPSSVTDIVDSIEVNGYRIQPPTSRHLARLAEGSADPELAAKQLLHDCVLSPATLPEDQQELAVLLDAVERGIEAADPWSSIAVNFRCPVCGHSDEADFDIASYLWGKIEQQARGLLDDIHLLAQAYGWTEPDILALGVTRRTAYLARVQS